MFRIARRVATDRVISTVDIEARHGHKSRNRRFDGYKAHLSVDPDSELIDEVTVTPANAPDRDAVGDLLGDRRRRARTSRWSSATPPTGTRPPARDLEGQGFNVIAKCPPARNSDGRFTKDRFGVDLDHGTVTCPAGQIAVISPSAVAAAGHASALVRDLPAAASLHQRRGAAAPSPSTRTRRSCSGPAPTSDPAWQQTATGTDRPTVERKIAHFTRRAWGGRKARTRGRLASPPTWTPAPRPSTGPAWPSSASTTTRPAGHCGPPEHPGSREDHPRHRPPATAQPSPPASTTHPKSRTAARPWRTP